MTADYYDLDDVVADSEKIPCRFNITVPGLGYLEGNPGKALQKDTKIELPLWLAEVLAVSGVSSESDTSFVDFAEPDFMNNKVMNAIKTDPVSIDLHAISPSYYRLVEKWCALFQDTASADVVMQMLKERAYEINNVASNAGKQINNDFTYSLDDFEKKLLTITTESNKQMRSWMNN